ncbi:unnamed protein product [Bemisia tabaci]|uniref:Uncharacterized protein n=1 Tax=Bemisia tabaci TaxID=7038 RepID=A0A9P0ABP2_BEMTA|nr:unnamed protein product [Bemisia tabaci]
MTSSVSVGISEEEEEDQEINVDSNGEEMEEDFDLEDSEAAEEDERLRADETDVEKDDSSDSRDVKAAMALPFSISRLLGRDDAKPSPDIALYSHPGYFSRASPPTSDSLIFTAGNGVIRVPAHRPANPGLHTPGIAAPFPWLAAAMDPALMHRSAAPQLDIIDKYLNNNSKVASTLPSPIEIKSVKK